MTRIVVLGSCPKALIRFREHLLRALVANGHEVLACAPGERPEITARLNRIGVDYQPVNLHRTSLNPAHDLATVYDLIRHLRRIRPHVLLAYTIKPVIYGSIAAHYAGVPHIFSLVEGLGYVFSGQEPKRRLLASLTRPLYRLGLRFNERVFVLNHDDARLFSQWNLIRHPNQCQVIPGIGIDLAYFTPAPLPSRPAFLLLGRLLRDKGVYEYVEAARRLKRRYPAATFRLAGAIDANPSAIRSAELEAWQAEGCIDYLGEISDVRAAIADTAVQVLPSYREGMPVSVMEAMAMGRPVIASDAPGCREAVCHGVSGYLVPPRSSSALADAMETFITKPERIAKYGSAARQLAEARFDVHRVNNQLLHAMGLA